MNNFSKKLDELIKIKDEFLRDIIINRAPVSLYEPINYLLKLQGKNTRSILSMLSYGFFHKNYKGIKNLILSIESLHNFSLIHDDVMDNASKRRGFKTINSKWSNNQAILSGDVLLLHSYNYLVKGNYNNDIIDFFTKTSIEICEGQQLDIDMQNQLQMSIDDYYKMINLKTGVLIKFSLAAPCLLSYSGRDNFDAMSNLGENIGLLFQIQDDFLDFYGDENLTGKLLGGDVFENKKTFLYVKALESCDDKQKKNLINIYHSNDNNKYLKVKKIFNELKIRDKTERKMTELSDKIFNLINNLNIDFDKKKLLLEYIRKLINRKS